MAGEQGRVTAGAGDHVNQSVAPLPVKEQTAQQAVGLCGMARKGKDLVLGNPVAHGNVEDDMGAHAVAIHHATVVVAVF